MREWIFFTDLHTFKDRYELVQKNGLQGFCTWVLGEEDPGDLEVSSPAIGEAPTKYL